MTTKKQKNAAARDAVPQSGIIVMDFGATTPSSTPSKYPLLPDPDGEVSKIVGQLIENVEDYDALDASIKLDKAELRLRARDFYFSHYAGKSAIASSILCRNGEGGALVEFKNQYKGSDPAEVEALIGKERAGKLFHQDFEFKIEGDKIPKDTVGAFVTGLRVLLATHGCTEAMTIKSVIVPTADFHTARHTVLTLEENRKIALISPMIEAVKTKGVK